MKYEDRYILPLFHERSAGRTRTGEADYPYLQSVESKWDVVGSESEVSFRSSEFAQRIKNFSDAPSLDPERLSSEIQIVKRDDAGYVLQIKIGPRTYTGDDVQYALDLPSTCFTIDTRTSGTNRGYSERPRPRLRPQSEWCPGHGRGRMELFRHFELLLQKYFTGD